MLTIFDSSELKSKFFEVSSSLIRWNKTSQLDFKEGKNYDSTKDKIRNRFSDLSHFSHIFYKI